MEKYLSIEEFAAYVGKAPQTVYQSWRKWAVSGLKVFLVGSTPRFRVRDIDAWIEKKNQYVAV